jgi:acetylornithine deacetylase/succinyl-diaminopimelate desuccinylase-like protein
LRAAAEFLTRLPSIAAAASPSAVVTCGQISVEPGGANVVPEKAVVRLDFRAPERATVAELRSRLMWHARDTAELHDVEVDWLGETLVDPVAMNPAIRTAICAAADGLGVSRGDLPSGAGHDAQNMAVIAPAGMIFVPSRDGRSHSPLEYTDPDFLVRGADVLLRTLLHLAAA